MADEKLPVLRPSQTRQIRLGAILLGASAIVLIGGYFLFLRMQTVPLYEGLPAADAAALVGELEAQGVAYSLADSGTTVRVAKSEADSIRLSLAGKLSAENGLDGFELFNESDMGLTEFAQRIKYQRALQGELARSIIRIEGISSARVHIALPERSMFRGGQSRPTAAVTLWLAVPAEAATISGVQHMIAASVPDLQIEDVVVLDQAGRLLSKPVFEVAGEVVASEGDMTAARPVQIAVADTVLPHGHTSILEAELRAILPDPAVNIIVAGKAPKADSGAIPDGPHVLIISDLPLENEAELAVRAVIASAASGVDSAHTAGSVEFLVRKAMQDVVFMAGPPADPDEPSVAARDLVEIAAFARRHAAEIAGGGALMLGAAGLLFFRQRGSKDRENSREEFAAHLKAELNRRSEFVDG